MVETQQEGGLVIPNFSEVQDRVGEGIYKVRILGHEMGRWEGKEGKPGTTWINWKLETFAESEDKNNGRKIFHRTPIEGAGAFKLQDLYRAAMSEDLAGPFAPTSLYGKEVQVTVGFQKDKPEYTEVKSVRPITH